MHSDEYVHQRKSSDSGLKNGIHSPMEKNFSDTPSSRRQSLVHVSQDAKDEHVNSSQRKHSLSKPSEHTYLKHTANSFRRMSITQDQLDHDLGRRLSFSKQIARRLSNEINDPKDDLEDNATSDIAEITSEIQRVEHFMDMKNRHLRLEQLKIDITSMKKSTDFEEEISKQQQKQERRKSTVDNYMYRRRSVTKATNI